MHYSILDSQDPLARFREQFVIDDPDLIYMDGNSLGRLPKRAAQRADELVNEEWGKRLIRGWGEGWFTAPQRIGAKVAQMIGAQADEVIVTDSTSVNFFKLAVAALEAQAGRPEILTDELNFPSDIYLLQGVARLRGGNSTLTILRSHDGQTISTEAIQGALSSQTALLTLTHTAFKSGYVYDMPGITSLAHDAGALTLWDLSHSVGVMPLALNECGVDLAVGCTYKYLNGGPGAPAFLYVRRDLQEKLQSPIWGWFGQQNQFDMSLDYRSAAGVNRFLAGTPGMLSLAMVECGVDILLEAGMEPLREKSMKQTEYFIELWQEHLRPLGVTLNSPRETAQRGSHVSLGHAEGLRIDRALIEDMKVIPDFRYPDNIRFGIAPIYTTYRDIYEAVVRMKEVITRRLYEKFPAERPDVT